jgi:HPt (histidine-containing phosphotransfer) domain-containing protein
MEGVAKVTAEREAREAGEIAEPIDLGYLARVTQGNRVLEREVLELFVGQLPVYVEQLRWADNQKDWRFAAHTIKGSALAVGAHRLADLAHLAEGLDLEVEPADRERLRRQAADGVAAASDEACRYVACLFATA